MDQIRGASRLANGAASLSMIQLRLRKNPSPAHVDMAGSITGCILAIIFVEEEEVKRGRGSIQKGKAASHLCKISLPFLHNLQNFVFLPPETAVLRLTFPLSLLASRHWTNQRITAVFVSSPALSRRPNTYTHTQTETYTCRHTHTHTQKCPK